MTENQAVWLEDLEALDTKIRETRQLLDELRTNREEMVKQQLWAKGPYKPVHSKPKNSYYNQKVERLEGNWKGKEHIG